MAWREVTGRRPAASRRPRWAMAVVVLATVGLLVSLVAGAAAVWPRLDPGPVVRGAEPGSGAVAVGALAAVQVHDRVRPSAGPREQRQEPRARAAVVPRPLRVTVPAVGLDLPVRPVGVAEDGQMWLPRDLGVVGWYRYGPAPGAPGSAVLAGHVDSWKDGVGPLARLREVEVGDAVVVRTAKGTVLHTVTAVEQYPKQALPDSVFQRNGPARLRLITCGGEFDEEAGSYRDNLVVTAEPRR